MKIPLGSLVRFVLLPWMLWLGKKELLCFVCCFVGEVCQALVHHLDPGACEWDGKGH